MARLKSIVSEKIAKDLTAPLAKKTRKKKSLTKEEIVAANMRAALEGRLCPEHTAQALGHSETIN